MAYNDVIVRALQRTFEVDDRDQFTNCALVFAYNGTGKTRLSYDFAHYGRGENAPQHTLYYNAYTEDLFTWDNDLENNTNHHLLINQNSALIQGLAGSNFSEPLGKYLQVFTDIDFKFHYDEQNAEIPDYVVFSKKIKKKKRVQGEWKDVETEIENIKISRGEERLFVWCFFRCILDQVVGETEAYKNIEYIYIDDLAKIVYQLIDKDVHNDAVNIGCGRGYSVNDVLAFLKIISKVDFKIEYENARPMDVSNMVLDTTKMLKYVDIELTPMLKGMEKFYQESLKDNNHA